MKVSITLELGEEIRLSDLMSVLEPFVDSNEDDSVCLTPFTDEDFESVRIVIARKHREKENVKRKAEA